jgi:signal transduction histidine kinase
MSGVHLQPETLAAPRRARSSRLIGRGLLRSGAVRYGLGIAALAALYYGAAKVGYVFEFAGPVAAIVWLPVGVGIAALYIAGPAYWPGVVIGDLLANDYSALPLGSAFGQTVGNVLEVVVAAVLMRRFLSRRRPLGNLRGLGCVLGAIAVGTLVSASVGALSLRLGHVITTHDIPRVWRTWWLGDAGGALIVVPLALAWYRSPPSSSWRGREFEAALMLLAVVGLSELALRGDRPLTYVVFPALIWAALRFGPRGATLAVAITAGFTVWGTTHYVGPFVFHSITHSVLSTQIYLAVAALSTLCLAVVVSEREQFAERLRDSRARLIRAGETERRRLEHNLHDGAQQQLIALLVRLRLASERTTQAPEQAATLFEQAEVELSQAIDDLRELAHGIHPHVLADLGLAEAIKGLAARSTVPITVLDLPRVRLDEATEATAYFVTAEAVANAQKHAEAMSVQVTATLTRKVLTLEIADDGVGGAAVSAGSGLEGLRDRVEAVGGTFEVDSPLGAGTRLTAVIPARAAA